MKMTFRWYGESDPVKLEYIRQIPGIYGIVSAICDVPVGEFGAGIVARGIGPKLILGNLRPEGLDPP